MQMSGLIAVIGKTVLGLVAVLLLAAGGLAVADSLYVKKCQIPPLVGKIITIPGERMEILGPGPGQEDGIRYDTVRDPDEDPNYVPRYEDGHVHPSQEERFDIIEGRARFIVGDEDVTVAAGETVVVPPNTVHNWIALDNAPVRVLAEYRPSLDTAEWFYSFHGAIDRGEMNWMLAMVIQSEFRTGAPWPASPSPAVWKAAMKVLAPIGRLMGYRAC